MNKFINKILKEAAIDKHYLDRLFERILHVGEVEVGYEISKGIYKKIGTYLVPEIIKDKIKDNLSIIESYGFNKKKSYGIKIIEIPIDKNKINYYDEVDKFEKLPTLVIVDSVTNSNGNVIYAIIRENVLTTIYFGKSYVPQTIEKLRVDAIVKMEALIQNKVY